MEMNKFKKIIAAEMKAAMLAVAGTDGKVEDLLLSGSVIAFNEESRNKSYTDLHGTATAKLYLVGECIIALAAQHGVTASDVLEALKDTLEGY